MSTCSTTESLIDRLDYDHREAKFRSELLQAFSGAVEKAEEGGHSLGVMSAVESLLDSGDVVDGAAETMTFFAVVKSLDPMHAKVFLHLASNGFRVEIMPPMPLDDDEFFVRVSHIPLSEQLGL